MADEKITHQAAGQEFPPDRRSDSGWRRRMNEM